MNNKNYRAESDHLRRNILYATRYWTKGQLDLYRPQIDAAIERLHHMTLEAAGPSIIAKHAPRTEEPRK